MNTPNYREIEKKFRFKATPKQLRFLVAKLREVSFLPSSYLKAYTIDNYWEVPGKADFLRLRHSWGYNGDLEKQSLKEITIKKKDRGSNLDRLEINGKIGAVKVFRQLLEAALGHPRGSISKLEHVFWTPDHAVISLCRIKKQWYLEVEAQDLGTVSLWCEAIKTMTRIGFVLEPRSLYEIYVGGGE